jgi:hypothetical protein
MFTFKISQIKNRFTNPILTLTGDHYFRNKKGSLKVLEIKAKEPDFKPSCY